jgi:hypothetical protein
MKNLLIGISLLCLSACGSTVVESELIQATNVCQANGGVRLIVAGLAVSTVKCKNGGEFRVVPKS